MSLPLYIHGSSDVGRQRSQNEDSFRIASRPDGSRLLAVCDGMGGHEAGEVASQVASDRIIEVLTSCAPDHPPGALYQMFIEANQAVLDAVLTRGAQGMGTTGVVAWVMDARCYVGWVGDSRLYQFRGGALVERTRDHTRVAHLLAHGAITPEEARDHPEAHVLTRVLGGSTGVQKGFKPEVWTEPLELRAGDVLLLCSDGLYDFIEDHEMYPLMEGRDYQDAVSWLIRTANERGGADNITVILLVAGQPEVPRRVEAPRPARRETLPDGMPLVVASEPATPVPEPVPVTVRTAVTVPFPVTAPVATAPVVAAPVVAAPIVAAPVVVASSAADPAPTTKPGRRVPLWWLLATGVVALGVGLALGLRAASEAPPPTPVQTPPPTPPPAPASPPEVKTP